MNCPNRFPNPVVCQVVQANLRQIGLNMDIRVCRHCPFEPIRGEATDLRLEAWHMNSFDPYDFVQLVDGATITPRRSVNLSYFDHPEHNRRIRRARGLVGPRRYRAFNALDHDLMRRAVPVAVYGSLNDRHYVSARTGCYHHHPVYGFDFPAICLRR